MGALRSFLKKVVSVFRPSKYRDNLVRGLEAIADYLDDLIPVLEAIRDAAKDASVGGLQKLAPALGLSADNLRGASMQEMMFNLALDWAMRRWPNAPLRHLRRAIEVAYGAIKP